MIDPTLITMSQICFNLDPYNLINLSAKHPLWPTVHNSGCHNYFASRASSIQSISKCLAVDTAPLLTPMKRSDLIRWSNRFDFLIFVWVFLLNCAENVQHKMCRYTVYICIHWLLMQKTAYMSVCIRSNLGKKIRSNQNVTFQKKLELLQLGDEFCQHLHIFQGGTGPHGAG